MIWLKTKNVAGKFKPVLLDLKSVVSDGKEMNSFLLTQIIKRSGTELDMPQKQILLETKEDKLLGKKDQWLNSL